MRVLGFFYIIIKVAQFKRLDQQRAEGVVKRRLLPPPNTLARQHYRQPIALSNIFDVAGVSPLIGIFKDGHNEKIGASQAEIDGQGAEETGVRAEEEQGSRGAEGQRRLKDWRIGGLEGFALPRGSLWLRLSPKGLRSVWLTC
jgi:hypothetical protein